MDLQGLDTYGFESCEFLKKFRAETSRNNYAKNNGMCPTLESFTQLDNPATFSL